MKKQVLKKVILSSITVVSFASMAQAAERNRDDIGQLRSESVAYLAFTEGSATSDPAHGETWGCGWSCGLSCGLTSLG